MATLNECFRELKAAYPDAILLFRVGDFYECYKQDAVDCARITGITCSSRKNHGQTMDMAGFPFHKLDTYLSMIVKAGRRVAICDKDWTDCEVYGEGESDCAREWDADTLPRREYTEIRQAMYDWEMKKYESEGYKHTGDYCGMKVFQRVTSEPQYSAQAEATFIGTDGSVNYFRVSIEDYAKMRVKPILNVFCKPDRYHDFDGIKDKTCDYYKGLGWSERWGSDLHSAGNLCTTQYAIYFVY